MKNVNEHSELTIADNSKLIYMHVPYFFLLDYLHKIIY